MPSHRRIDVHHHILPLAYAAWLRSRGLRDAGGRPLPDWSVETTLAFMDEHDIATGIFSVSTPGVHLDPSKPEDPYAPAIAVGYFTGQLDAFGALDADSHAAIDRGSAEVLFPQFAATCNRVERCSA